MDGPLVSALYLVGCALQFVLGIGVTLALRKRLPRGAYWLGFLVPVLVPILLGLVYTQVAPPCSSEDTGACGDELVFILLAGVLLFNLGVSAMIQFVMWRIEWRKNPHRDESWKKRDL